MQAAIQRNAPEPSDCESKYAIGTGAANLTRQLLSFSRKQVLQPKTLDLNSVVASLATMLRRVIGEDIVLSFDYSKEPAMIEGDENMLGQVLMNLVVNARDALPAGGRLRVSTEIKVLDDEGPVRCLARMVLERLGYNVLEAGTGVEALQVWEQHQHQIALVLTDMVMPGGINGRDLVERLLAKQPGLKFIYSSGYHAIAGDNACDLLCGANFLEKPYHPAKLAQAVRERLDV